MTSFFSREARPLNPWVALGALVLGIALFSAMPLAAYGLHDHAGIMGLFYFLFTPLFGIPLALALLNDGRMRWWGLLYFVVWLTGVHYIATGSRTFFIRSRARSSGCRIPIIPRTRRASSSIGCANSARSRRVLRPACSAV
ncbi:MAG TPA: hypothetical protein VHL34_22220 [Rhizomicrobium sp.]|jgi:hypothetical protein|nr:hypothetical protein [Rhizomicrobium sp.]